MLSTETQEKARTTPVTIPPLLRVRLELQCDADRRGVEAEILTLLDEAITTRERKK